MTREIDLESRQLNDLRKRCAEESTRYFQRQDHDTRFCFEMFRRAILNRDETAWEFIYEQYKPLVTGWIEGQSVFSALDEEREYFVNRAFEKMWSSLSPEKFANFASVSALLAYLRTCVGSTIIDHARATARHQWEEIPDPALEEVRSAGPGLEELVFSRVQTEEFWDRMNAYVSNRKEYLALYGSYVLDLKPREILEHYPGEFKDIQEIYLVKGNLIERFKRNHELIGFLSSYIGK